MYFLLGIKVLTLLSKIRTYLRFCFVPIEAFSKIKMRSLHLVGNQLWR